MKTDNYWNDAIKELRANQLMMDEVGMYDARASSWTTCACGKLDGGVPRFLMNIDEDPGEYEKRRVAFRDTISKHMGGKMVNYMSVAGAPLDMILVELGLEFSDHWNDVGELINQNGYLQNEEAIQFADKLQATLDAIEARAADVLKGLEDLDNYYGELEKDGPTNTEQP